MAGFITDVEWLRDQAMKPMSASKPGDSDAMHRAADLILHVVKKAVPYNHKPRSRCHKETDCDDCLRRVECGESGWCMDFEYKETPTLASLQLDHNAIDKLDDVLSSVIKLKTSSFPELDPEDRNCVKWRRWVYTELQEIMSNLGKVLKDRPQL